MWIEASILGATLLYLVYKWGTTTFQHWSKRGVRHMKPYSWVGNQGRFFYDRMATLDAIRTHYERFKEHRFAGLYNFKQPILMINDPDLIKQITVKDFDHFTNRNRLISEEADPLFGANLLNIVDQRWRDTRNTLSPAFTSSKIKNMFVLVEQCAEQLTKHVEKTIEEQVQAGHPDGDVYIAELKQLLSKFSTDVIASTAFGIQVDSIADPDNEFYKMGTKISQINGWRMIRFLGHIWLPKVMQYFKIPVFSKDMNDFFFNLVRGSIAEREAKHIVRPDLIHLMMQARKGVLTDENDTKTKKAELTETDITAQALLFFFAGFETTSTTLGFVSFELALHPDIQERLQQEIDRVMEEEGGTMTYDALMNKMTYLDMVLSESLRKWPPGFVTDRKVSKTYVIPAQGDDPEVTLQRDDAIWIVVCGLHRDERYFPDPDRFDPERFSEENKSKILPFTYLPFGAGPRNCIGMRFALMEVKACMVHLLKKYTIVITEKTKIPLRLDKSIQTQLAPEGGFTLGFTPRKAT